MELQAQRVEADPRIKPKDKVVLNALAFSCWSDEDYIGRVARLARRVGNSRKLPHSTISRALVSYRKQLRKHCRSAMRI